MTLPHHPELQEIPAASCRPRGSADGIVTAQTSALIGLKPASLLQHEMLADVRDGSLDRVIGRRLVDS